MECAKIDPLLNVMLAVQLISMAIPVIAAIVAFRSLKAWSRLLFVYVSAMMLVEAGACVSSLLGRHNLWIYNGGILVEFGLLTLAFSTWTGGMLKILFRSSIAVYFCFWLIEMLNGKYLFEMSSTLFTITYLLLLFISLICLIHLIMGSNTLLRDARFWACITVLFYTAGDLGTYAIGNYFLTQMYYHDIIWIVHLILSILVNFLWAGVFLCQHRHHSSG